MRQKFLSKGPSFVWRGVARGEGAAHHDCAALERVILDAASDGAGIRDITVRIYEVFGMIEWPALEQHLIALIRRGVVDVTSPGVFRRRGEERRSP